LELEYSKAMVDAAMERLPGEQREAVRLHYLSGLSCAEIARLTGTPQPTVASHLLQGLHRLSAALEKPSEVLP
jgi:RNA polymerase sigma-70 factor (ECF subfamily)